MSEASKLWLISFQRDIVLRIALNVVRKHILHQLVSSIETLKDKMERIHLLVIFLPEGMVEKLNFSEKMKTH